MRLIKNDNLWTDPFADFDTFLSRAFGMPNRSALAPELSRESYGGFRLDLHQDDDNYYVVAELPGVEKNAVNIELENAVLTIGAERRSGEGDSERVYSFSRSVTVSDDIVAEKVDAKLENGLLTVTLPKAEQRKPRTIAIT